MINEKEYDIRFFDYFYYYMQEFVQPDDIYNAKNKACFEKLYRDMEEAFANSEDALHIRWGDMWFNLIYLLPEENGAGDKKTEVSPEIIAKYKDIDVFFGILHQCMIFMADSKMNEGYKSFIKNIFKNTKDKFKELKNVDRVPWECMWQKLMNSDVYSMLIDEKKIIGIAI